MLFFILILEKLFVQNHKINEKASFFWTRFSTKLTCFKENALFSKVTEERKKRLK